MELIASPLMSACVVFNTGQISDSCTFVFAHNHEFILYDI